MQISVDPSSRVGSIIVKHQESSCPVKLSNQANISLVREVTGNTLLSLAELGRDGGTFTAEWVVTLSNRHMTAHLAFIKWHLKDFKNVGK